MVTCDFSGPSSLVKQAGKRSTRYTADPTPEPSPGTGKYVPLHRDEAHQRSSWAEEVQWIHGRKEEFGIRFSLGHRQ